MKRSIITIALLAGAVSVYSQGTINYSDYVGGIEGFNIHVYSPQLLTLSTEVTGNSTTSFATSPMGDNPAGTVNPGIPEC